MKQKAQEEIFVNLSYVVFNSLLIRSTNYKCSYSQPMKIQTSVISLRYVNHFANGHRSLLIAEK